MISRWERHVSDGALIRLIDGESFDVEEATTREHLARCGKCRERYTYLESLSDRTTELLLHDRGMSTIGSVAATAHRHHRGGIAAAIFIVLALAGSAWAWVATARSPSGPSPSGEVLQPSASIAFRPTGRIVEFRFASPQRFGGFELETTLDSLVAVTIVGGTGAEELSVSTRGVGIVNERASAAVYVVQVPAFVDSIAVEIGGNELYRIAAPEFAAGTLRLMLDSADRRTP